MVAISNHFVHCGEHFTSQTPLRGADQKFGGSLRGLAKNRFPHLFR
jgi:hypothetical protein